MATAIDYFNYLHLIILTFAAFSSFVILCVLYFKVGSTISRIRRILRCLATSNFCFSTLGLIYKAVKLLKSWQLNNDNTPAFISVLYAIRISLEITSFLWVIVLCVYIIEHKRWKVTTQELAGVVVGIFLLEFCCELNYRFSSKPTFALSLLIWDIVALLLLCASAVALFMYSRKNPSATFTNSLVMSRLTLTGLAFLLFVAPTIVQHGLMYCNQTENRMYKKVCTALFACFPFATNLIFLIQFSSDRIPAYNSKVFLKLSKRLESLEIGKKIGHGNTVVYKGTWRTMPVVVKMHPLHLHQNCPTRGFQECCNQGIQAEVRALQTLAHPNIVMFMEATLYNRVLCVVTQFCSSGSLRETLSRYTDDELVWAMKLRLATGIAKGLHFLHNACDQILHRNLTSSCIMVDEGWHPKIADFEVLRLFEIIYGLDTHSSGAVAKEIKICSQEYINTMPISRLLHSAYHVAPEVATASAYTEKIDIYSLGLVFWELTEHCLPKKEHVADFKFRTQSPRGWKDLIQACCAYNPEARPSSAELVAQLELIVYEELFHCHPDGLSEMDRWTQGSLEIESSNRSDRFSTPEENSQSIVDSHYSQFP